MKISEFTKMMRKMRSSFSLLASALVGAALFSVPCSGGEFSLREVSKIELPINAKAIAWHPDSKTIAAGGWAGMLTVWDARSGRLIRDLKQSNGVVESAEFSRDGRFLAIGKSLVQRGAYLTVFDTDKYGVTDEWESPNLKNDGGRSPGLDSISVDPKTSKRIAVLGYENSWDPVIFQLGKASREVIHIPPKPRVFVQRVAFSPTRDMLAVGRIDGSVDLYSGEDGHLLKSFTAYDKWVIRALIFSPDGKFMYTGSNTGSGHGYLDKATGKWHQRQNNEPIKMWDVQTLKLLRTFDPDGTTVWALATSPDGRYLYGGLGKRLTIWEVSTGAVAKRLDISAGGLIVKVSPDGKYLAIAGMGTRVIKIWSVAS